MLCRAEKEPWLKEAGYVDRQGKLFMTWTWDHKITNTRMFHR
jgi:hypothetical protein